MEDSTASLQNTPSRDTENTQWTTRYDAAWSTLHDDRAMSRLYRLVAHADPTDAPRAVPIAGDEALNRAPRIGVISGSFNPLTLAHIALAESARRSAGLDLVVWAIAARTVDKEGVVRATIADRLAQLSAYAQWAPADAVVLLNRGLYVEQADALRSLRGGGVHLAIVVGFDKIVQIFDPHYYTDRDAALDKLFARARLLVAPREDEDEGALRNLLAQPQNATYADRVAYIDLARRYRSDSSTTVRELLSRRDAGLDSVHALVPPEGFALAQLGAYVVSEDAGNDRYAQRVRRQESLCHTNGS